MASTRRLALALLASAAIVPGGSPALAQDEPKPPAPAPAPPAPPAAEAKAASAKEAKVRKYIELIGFRKNVMEQMGIAFETQAKSGILPKGFVKKFQEVADFGALEDIIADVWSELMDEPTLDAVNGFLESDAGRKYVDASTKFLRPMMEKIQPWAMEAAMKTMQALAEADGDEDGGDGEEDGGAMGNLGRAKLSANETTAIATLRNLASCQAQIQTSGKIDCDNDGIGEYGTFLEMTGSSGVRKGFVKDSEAASGGGPSDFSVRGSPVKPPILSPALADVNADGVVVRRGYCFRIFLPDSEKQAGFVHETGPKETPGLAGGTGKVHTDLAETTWCAYAWPEKRSDSGNRVFFVCQSGDVMQSANDGNRWEGAKAPPANAAFRGAGITSEIAVGTTGGDGEVWKLTN